MEIKEFIYVQNIHSTIKIERLCAVYKVEIRFCQSRNGYITLLTTQTTLV